MKSINNTAVSNMVDKKLHIMMSASSVEDLRVAYADIREALEQYYDACMTIAEYNELMNEFDPATVGYEPTGA